MNDIILQHHLSSNCRMMVVVGCCSITSYLDGGDTTAVVSSFATRANRPSKGGAFTGDATEDRVLLFSMMTTYKC